MHFRHNPLDIFQLKLSQSKDFSRHLKACLITLIWGVVCIIYFFLLPLFIHYRYFIALSSVIIILAVLYKMGDLHKAYHKFYAIKERLSR